MRILTLENETHNLTTLPDVVDDNFRFAILNNTYSSDTDFYYIPLTFLENFDSPAVVLKINDHELLLPADWSIAIGEEATDCDVELLPVTSLNGRKFSALCYNPFSSFRVEFGNVEIVNYYSSISWHFPVLKPGHVLCYPISQGYAPKCIFISRDISKSQELIRVEDLQ